MQFCGDFMENDSAAVNAIGRNSIHSIFRYDFIFKYEFGFRKNLSFNVPYRPNVYNFKFIAGKVF
jgi:hypothetical protein